MTIPPFLGNELITGKRVRLTMVQDSDLPCLVQWHNDLMYARLLRRGMVDPFASVDGFAEWLKGVYGKFDHDEFPFAIRTLEDDRLVGWLMIKDVFWQARHCSFFIGIGHAEDRGKGYGTDAVRTMLRFIFMEMNLNCVRLEVMAYNTDGIRAYERVGFRQDGRLRAFVYRDGVYYDIITMSILREEWEMITSPSGSADTAE